MLKFMAASRSQGHHRDNEAARGVLQCQSITIQMSDLCFQYDDGSAGPVLVRLCWHASGTYDQATKTGGSQGAGMRYEAEGGDPANAGLQHARVFLEPIKAKHSWITYSE